MEVKNEGGATAPEKEKPEEVVVTLEHSSFGSYTFRAEEGKVASAISPALARAKKEAAAREECAKIDKQQVELHEQIAEGWKRIEAAKMLNDTARESREKSACDALQKSVNALAARRQDLLDSLEK
jgi:hypothetical protein